MPPSPFDPTHYYLNPHAIPLLAASGVVLALGLWVLIRERAPGVNVIFFILTQAIALWFLCYGFMLSTPDEQIALLWARAAFAGIAILPAALYHCGVTILHLYSNRASLIRLSWLTAVTFVLADHFANLVVIGVHRYWWGFHPAFGLAGQLHIVFMVSMMFLTMVEFLLAHRMLRSAAHKRPIRMFLATVLLSFFALSDYLPALGVTVYPAGYLVIFLVLAGIAWTIRRYRLFEITPAFAAEQVLAKLSDPLVVCDAAGDIQYVNQACSEIFGYPEKALIGRNVSVLAYANPVQIAVLEDAIRKSSARDEEFLFSTREGVAIPVSISIAPLEDRRHSPVGLVLIARDIREKKRAEAALQASEQRLSTVVAHTPILLFAIDRSGIFTLAEGKALTALKRQGLAPAQAVGRSVFDMLGRIRPDISERFYRALLGEERGITVEIAQNVYACQYAPVRDSDGSINGIIGVATDITERRRAELALAESEKRYALAARGANDGLWDWNLASNDIYLSPRWKGMLGYDEASIGRHPDDWLSLIHPDDASRVQSEVEAHRAGETEHLEFEYRVLHQDGQYRWMLCRGLAVRDEHGNATRMAGSQTDITDRKEVEAQLIHHALHDALTRLPNRALFMDRVDHAIKRLGRTDTREFAVLFLDFDRFKLVNDSFGHNVGNHLLIAIARRIETCLRTEDTLARLGGDEFGMLVNDLEQSEDVIAVVSRIQEALKRPFYVDGLELYTTVSIGIALATAHYHRAEDLLRDADIAMYRAKVLGKARYQLFDMSMRSMVTDRFQLETDLRRAVDRQEFELHYQPIIWLHNGQIAGLEALVRWKHPSGRLIHPADFIGVAEETGLIAPIGQWVLRQACQAMQKWQSQFPGSSELTISVNLSSKQLAQPTLCQQIASILDETDLDPRCLKLEITESMVIENTEAVRESLLQLRALGIQLQMDDFGTGYSSLSYLHRLPIDTLKIDRSFIGRVRKKSEQTAIVQTILTLAHTLEMKVVAEGVETIEQLKWLRAHHCEYGQGFLFSPPLDGTQAEALLAGEHLPTSARIFHARSSVDPDTGAPRTGGARI